MRHIGQKISSALSLAGLYFASASFAYAEDICPPGQFSSLCNLKEDKIGSVVGNVIQILLILAVIVALIFLVWGGIRWVMSQGDQAKVQSARSTIIAAIVGLIIAFLAFFIVSFVLQMFTGKGFQNFEIPRLV